MIPLKIETLFEGRIVEQNRVEYKKGWNPCDVIHTICAFANDFENVNGGYIVIGVEAVEGIPLLPPCGVDKERLDLVQQEIFQYCNQIEPRYIPNIEVVNFAEDIYLIYLKCSPGDAGPYRAAKDIYSDKKDSRVDKTMHYWIRSGSITTIAKQSEISELFEKFNSVPFDDRINREAKIDIIRRSYLEDFIRDSKSSLAEDLNGRTMEDLLFSLEVARESDTEIELKNIAVLMFSERPDRLIPGAKIDLVKFDSPEAEAADNFIEKSFTGPIWKQIGDVLDYIKNNVIIEKVRKIDRAEKAERRYNYPYNALEEALVNAVFHKSYREGEAVEVRIYIDKIMIINFPGPDKWINMDRFSQGKVRARKYRNRRIGEMFKELDLSEKQGTGISKILYELKKNGSPLPIFETDENRTYLETTILCHKEFIEQKNVAEVAKKVSESMSESMSELEIKRLEIIFSFFNENEWLSSKIAAEILGVEAKTAVRLLNKAVKLGILSSQGKTKNRVYKIKEKRTKL